MVIVTADVMAVVGGDERNAKFFFQPQQVRTNLLLEREPLILNLEKEVVFAEDVAIGGGRVPRRIVLVCHQMLAKFSGQAARKSDQTFGMLRKELLAHTRFVVHAVERGFGRDLYQIAIAFVVLGQNEQVIVLVAFGSGAMIIFLADVEFAADDRLYAGLLRGVVK